MDVIWHRAGKNEGGIYNIGYDSKTIKDGNGKVVGYNDILIWDQVYYRGEIYYVVMVSRLGYFGLSKENKVGYDNLAFPIEVKRA